MFTKEPCVNCGTKLTLSFNLKKSKNICRKCLHTMKYSPLGREYIHGKINQLIVNSSSDVLLEQVEAKIINKVSIIIIIPI